MRTAFQHLAMALVLIGCQGWFESSDTPIEYVVARGDTLGKIAKRHDVTVAELRAWNGIEGDLIEVNQVLRIHRSPAVAPPTAPRSTTPTSRQPTVIPPPEADSDALPPLVLPAEKPCLSGPDAASLGEKGMAASQGLDRGEVRSAMDGFIQNATRCVTFDALPQGTLQMEIAVACTGRVDEVSIAQNPGWPQEVTDCVADVLRHAPLPAHDLPDGDVFGYPLRFTP